MHGQTNLLPYDLARHGSSVNTKKGGEKLSFSEIVVYHDIVRNCAKFCIGYERKRACDVKLAYNEN